MNLSTFSANNLSNERSIGKMIRPNLPFGPSKRVTDREIANAASISEATKIISERMATTLADELRRVMSNSEIEFEKKH